MGTNASIVKLNQPTGVAVSWVDRLLRRAGYSVLITFSLEQEPCSAAGCPCEWQDAEECTLKMVILLVYADPGGPVTLIAQCDGQGTDFSIVNTPEQQVDAGLEEAIRSRLVEAAQVEQA
jgi:hypothetical protein